MKLNIANPTTGQNLPLVIDDEKKLALFFGKKMGQEVPADVLGDNWKGYILKITGGNDKDGFAMKQGILLQGRTRLLMSAGHSTYRPRRSGERKKKSVRGCIVGPDIAALALSVVKQGEGQVEGLTNEKRPRRRGPKRATRIRKLFALQKKDDPRRFVVLYKRTIEKNGKTRVKCPKIQRLVTDVRLRRKRVFKKEKVEGWKASTKAKAEYKKLLVEVRKKRLAALTKEGAIAAAAKKGETAPATTTKTQPTKADPKATTKGGNNKQPATQAKGGAQQKAGTQATTAKPAQSTQKPTQTTTQPKDTKKTQKK